jgi:ADP-ribose pyrophosphatase YjhB (NUDIX family)
LIEAAKREVLEETGAVARELQLFAVHDLPQSGQVVFTFRAVLAGCEVLARDEQLESRLFQLEAIPWLELAFPTDQITLRAHYTSNSEASTNVNVAEIKWDPSGRILMQKL